VKQGRYFRIPERPADLHRLWNEAKHLGVDDLPAWLLPLDAASYRLAGSITRPGASLEDESLLTAELEQLEAAWLVVDSDETDTSIIRVYVPEPSDEQIWSIGIYGGPSPLELGALPGITNPVLDRDDVSDIPAVYVADPFMTEVGGCWYMFFEVMHWLENKGVIGLALSVDGAKTWEYQGIVLSEPFHLSYPYVFEWRDDYYLIPESHQAGSVSLYRATAFPHEWSLVGTLLEGLPFVDASIVHHRDHWWMFVATDGGQSDGELHLYTADQLTGPWSQHPRSPLEARDGRTRRPAGRVLVVAGRVLLYTQTSFPEYGAAVRASEITLTPRDYREREAQPSLVLRGSGRGWNADGMHHVDPHVTAAGRWIACVDGWYRGQASRP
jgi:hypothetical protein